MKIGAALASFLAVIFGVAIQASAEEKRKLTSLSALLADGYEVKATATAPGEKTSLIYVTLQKDKLIAVCSFSVGNYDNLVDATFEAQDRCSAR